MRRLFIASLVTGLSLGLAGCSLPDLVAHTVKAVEKSQRDGGSRTASSPPAESSRAAEPEEPPPPQSAPLPPRRSSITAEELPPR